MTRKNKIILKLLAAVYVVLVVLFFVNSALVSRGEGVRDDFSPDLIDTTVTEPVELMHLAGAEPSREVVEALHDADLALVPIGDDRLGIVRAETAADLTQARVGTSLPAEELAGRRFVEGVTLPRHTAVTRELWAMVLRPEGELRRQTPTAEDDVIYVSGAGDLMGFDLTLPFVALNFLGLLVLLYLFLWDPVLSMLDGRAEQVEGDLSHAAENRRKAEELKQRYDQLILGSKKERQSLVAEGRKEGESEKQRILSEARDEADKIVSRTREELEAAADKVRSDLRREIGGLSIDLARQVLRREVRPEDNEKLVDDFLSELDTVDVEK